MPLGDQVATLLPLYKNAKLSEGRRVYDHLPIWLGGTHYDASIYQVGDTTPYFFLDCPELYNRDGFYGTPEADFPDNDIRFAALSRAALEVARRIFRPQVIHCHDWQSGLVPAYLKTALAADPTFLGIKTLLTIHNLGYQGLFPKSALTADRTRPVAISPRGRGVLREREFPQGGHRVQRRHQYGEQSLRQRDSDARVWIRAGWPSAGAAQCADRDPERSRLFAVGPATRTARSRPIIRRRIWRASRSARASFCGSSASIPELAATRPVIGVVTRFAEPEGRGSDRGDRG